MTVIMVAGRVGSYLRVVMSSYNDGIGIGFSFLLFIL